MYITKIKEHLESMCDTPCDIQIESVQDIEDGAQFVQFTFDGEPQAAVYYPSDDILLIPTDWQTGHPTTPAEIEGYQWITSAGDEAIVMGWLPRLFTSVRDDARKALGAKIKALREDNGMSQDDLASLSGLQRPNISRIESGRYNVTLDTITRLSAALGEKLI